MADDTRLIISIETILKNLDRTLKGLSRVEKQLRAIASINPNRQSVDRAFLAAQRLELAQRRLAVQAQRLANQEERNRQVSERLAASRERATRAAQRAAQANERSRRAETIATERATRAQERGIQAQSRANQAERDRQRDARRAAFEAARRRQDEARGIGQQQDAHVRAFRRMQEEAQRFNRSITGLGNSLRSIGQGLASFGATLSIAVSAPLAALSAVVVNAAVQMDSLRRGLTTIAGSAELASVQLARLTEIAKLPGIGFQEAIQGSIALQAVGFSAGEAEKALIQFSNAVALTGGSREQLQAVTVQLGQMAAQSKVLAADLKPIINAAPAVAVALRNAFGTVRSEEIQELGIQSKDFIDIMVRELGKLPRAAAGARNSFDNFRDSVFRASALIGESLLPALVRLADAVGPVLIKLANAFAALPVPIQSTVLVVGALTIALGPMTFLFGQLITGLGRVVVGFAQLNALGLLPTIANFRLLSRVMIGTASLAQGTAATAAAAAAGWGALGAAIIAVIGIATAIAVLSTRTEEHVETTEEQIRATQASLKVLRAQRDVLSKVTKETEAVASVSEELNAIYKSLNKESQGRVEELRRELGMTEALRREIGRLITAREGEQAIQAITLAASVTDTAQKIQSLGQQLDVAITRIERLRKARESLITTGRLPRDIADPLLSSIASVDATRQLEEIDRKIKELSSERLPELRQQSDEATASLAKQSDQLQELEQATGRSTREILEQAKSYGLFKGDVDTAAQGIENFRKAQISLEAALTGTTEELIRQRLELRKLSAPADEAQKQRRLLIDSAIDFARENSSTIDEAKKKLDEFAEKFPEVRKAIEDELKKRPIEEFLREITGRRQPKAGRGETGLRNARQALADALEQIALASSAREVEVEQDKNAALLQAMETAQRLRLVSYREYLETRASLTAASLDKEIEQQEKIVATAKLAQARLLREALRAGIPEAERTRRRAQAAGAEKEAIEAETRLIVLRRQRDRIEAELTQVIREAQDDQLKSVQQLEIEYAELGGRIEDALKAAAVEEFREALEDLGKAQDFLNKQIEKAANLRQADRIAELERARNLNQRQIEAINNIVRQREALAELAAAEKLVENAKERQKRLEEDLQFQVQFRGLAEEEAIRRRLEGEKQLQDRLQLAASIIEDLRQRIENLGFTPPPELEKFIQNLKVEIQGLGELPFSEQFRLAEKEFNRLNDERLRRIADVERAVRKRDIAEVEGRLLVKKINGEYIADLERQLEVLKDIAKRSKDEGLKRQAADTAETVKDARDQIIDFDKQLRATSIDSFRDSFVEFFRDLRDNTENAAQDFLNFLDRIGQRITDLIAENFADKLIESILGTGDDKGILAQVRGIFGGGIQQQVGVGAAGAATGAAITGAATTAGAAIATGGATAGAALTTGGVTASTTLVASITGAAAAFSAAVVAAGAAFAAAVTAAAGAQAAGAFTGLGGNIGFAAGDFLKPKMGGVLARIAEGGHSEAVLTTDPRYAARQAQILVRYLKETRGLFGRFKVPEFAEGAFLTPRQAEVSLLNTIERNPVSLSRIPEAALVAPDNRPSLSFRNINLFDRKAIAHDYLRSAEGARDILNIVSENGDEIGRRLGLK